MRYVCSRCTAAGRSLSHRGPRASTARRPPAPRQEDQGSRIRSRCSGWGTCGRTSRGEALGSLDLGVGADIWDGLAEFLPEREQGKEQRFGETAERELGRVDRGVEGRDRPWVDVGPVVGVTRRFEGRERTGSRLAAVASRAENGWPSGQCSRSVWITEVLRYWSFTTVRSGIQAEIAIAGTRTPDRSKRKLSWPAAAWGSGGGAGGGT
jgi:hypothetical protein